MSNATLILIDGENLLFRYEAMCRNGRVPRAEVVHSPSKYVWCNHITKLNFIHVLRVSYYTTFVGEDKAIDKICYEISNIRYSFDSDSETHGTGTLNPHVYKKSKQSTKTKSVDINLSIDALRHTYNRTVVNVDIISGDGDYLPLVNEIMRQGISVGIWAFSDGCHPDLKHVPDDFTCLDNLFFEGGDSDS